MKRSSKSVRQCIKQSSKKYTSRNSPPYSASDCPNKIMTGNDGQLYFSLRSGNSYRWIIYSKEKIEKHAADFKKYMKEKNARIKLDKEKRKSRKSPKRKRSSRK